MHTQASRRINKEIVLAFVSGALGLVTLLWEDWLEVSGWEPDHRGGAVEWMVAATFLLVGLVIGLRGAATSSRGPRADLPLRTSDDAKPTSRWL